MTEALLARVLIVEFDPLQRDLMVMALNRSRFQPIVCDAVDHIQPLIAEHQPEIIILDLYLPGSNGITVLGELTREGLLAQMGAIVISSMGFMEVVQQAIRAGADDFLMKPVDVELLLARVHSVLNRKSSNPLLSA